MTTQFFRTRPKRVLGISLCAILMGCLVAIPLVNSFRVQFALAGVAFAMLLTLVVTFFGVGDDVASDPVTTTPSSNITRPDDHTPRVNADGTPMIGLVDAYGRGYGDWQTNSWMPNRDDRR